MKNLTYLLPALAISFLSLTAMAQSENDTIYNRNNSLFAQLDTGRIPTGYLMDRAMAAGGNLNYIFDHLSE